MVTDALSKLADGLQRLNSIKKEMSELDLREAILEQRSLLLDLKEEVLSLREKNEALALELAAKSLGNDKLSQTKEIDGFRFDIVDGNPKGLPYCPTCEVREDGKLYRLNRSNEYYADCPNCSTSYNVGKDGRVHEKSPPRRSTVTGMF